MLGAAGDYTLNVVFLQVSVDHVNDLSQIFFTGRGALGHHVLDLVIDLGIEHLEGTVFKFPLDGVHTQAVRQRGINL